MKQIIITFFFLASFNFLSAQSNSEINSVESPSSSSSLIGDNQQGEVIDVDLYTGTAKINLPIFNLSSTSLSIPISLNYVNGKGIRLQDFAKTTGLGWQLSAGGFITRTVRGKPDENMYGYIAANTPSGNDVKSVSLTGYSTNGDPYLNPALDPEPDLFKVTTPFFSFNFSFDENGIPIIPNNTGYKVVSNIYHVPTGTTITFQVIDNNGNKYYFGSNLTSQDNLTTDRKRELASGQEIHIYNTFPCNWYLDKIVTFNSKDVIDFSYTTSYNNVNSYTIKFYNFQRQTFYYNNSYGQGVAPFDLERKSTYNSAKYLSAIETNLGRVDFEYAFDRLDLPQVGRLQRITAKAYNPQTQQKDRMLKRFVFNYSYFGLPSNDPDALRLKLNGIDFWDNATPSANTFPLFTFDYNVDVNLPSRKSPQFDYWGYYNITSTQANNTGSLVPYAENRSPSIEGTSANILKEIKTLTGGTTKIQYEQNTYYNGGNVLAGGLRVKKISKIVPTGNGHVRTFVYNEANGNSTGTIYGFNNGTTVNTLYNVIHNLTNNYGPQFNDGGPVMNFFPAWAVETFTESDFNTYDVSGNDLGYSKVKVVEANGGYTINSFSNFLNFQDIYTFVQETRDNLTGQFPGECPPPNISIPVPRTIKATNLSFKRGLLTNKSVYNSNGIKLTEQENIYSSLNNTGLFSSYGIHGIRTQFQTIVPMTEYYRTSMENYRLTQTIDKKYDQNNPSNYLMTTTSYTYPSNFWQLKNKTVIDSKGALYSEDFYYAEDNNIPMLTSNEQYAINLMKIFNNINPVIHKVQTKNGNVLQLHNSYSENNAKIYLTSETSYNGSYITKKQNYDYDANTSNLVSSYVDDNKRISNTYGYRSSYPIVTIDNANAVNESFYNSFEEVQGANFSQAHTGKASYNAIGSPYVFNFSMPNSKSYILQWWSWNSSLNKWVMNEQPYLGSASLSGIIDDIRVFPTDAQITTATYDPLIGITSSLNTNGDITYYEYDLLSRLSLIRDKDKNIIKKFSYGFAGQPTPCTNSTPNWQNTAAPLRCELGGCGYTGYQEQEQRDMNPCSLTYFSTRWVSTGIQNTATCPIIICINLTSTNTYNTTGYVASYYNTITGLTYTFNVSNASGLQTLGTIPQGNYTLTITRPIGAVNTIFKSGCFKQIITGNSAIFYNVNVTPTTCNSITVTMDAVI